MRELAADTHQFSATVTGIVDRLVRDGLVERKRHVSDRRVVLVCLTPAGRDLMRRVSDANRALIKRWLSSVDHEEATQLLELLTLFLGAMEDDRKNTADSQTRTSVETH